MERSVRWIRSIIRKEHMSLEASERETIFVISDDVREWIVYSCRRSDITSLKKNPDFVITEEGTYKGGTPYVHGTLPMGGIAIRKKSAGTIKRSDAGVKRRITAATCKHIKADGVKCGSIAKKDTGYCNSHP